MSTIINQRTLYIDNKTIYIQRTEDTHVLTVSNIGSNISISYSNDLPLPVDSFKKHTVDAVLGILPLKEDYYLLCVSSSAQIGFFGKHQISQVKDIKLFPLSRFPSEEFLSSIIGSITDFYRQGFFFSNTFDLSNNISTQKGIKEASLLPDFRYDIIEHGNHDYLANEKLITIFREKKLENSDSNANNNYFLSDFIANSIYGFVGFINYSLKTTIGKENDNDDDLKNYFKYLLISRRQIRDFGLHYYKQGIDSFGNCADEIETESIMLYNRNIFSFLISRGNPPCDYHRDIDFLDTPDPELQALRFNLFSKYITGLVEQYSLICFVSLLDTEKEIENALENQLKSSMSNYFEKEIKYIHLVYNSREATSDFLGEFIEKNESYLNIFKYFGRLNNGDLIEQCGLFRLSCINGKKSNDLQMRILWNVLRKQFISIGIDVDATFGSFFTHSITSNINSQELDFIDLFKNLWFENYTRLNNQYNPQLNCNLLKQTQKMINILLNKPNTAQPEDIVQRINKYDKLTYKRTPLTISIHSWNVGSFDPSVRFINEKAMKNWIRPYYSDTNKYADIVIIGLQEVIELNTQNVLTKTKASGVIINHWKTAFDKVLLGNEDKVLYEAIEMIHLVGIVLFVYIRKDIKAQDPFFKVDKFSLKTGLAGQTGNKGSCMISMIYKQSTIAISCSHLAAGVSSNGHRLTELTNILQQTFENHKLKFKEHDSYFIFGDLNFRIHNDKANSFDLIKENNLLKLKSYDQLIKLKAAYVSLKTLDEGELNFKPTYKYIPGTHEWDMKKDRLPSWCDRILYRKCRHIKMIQYSSIEEKIGYSDHIPIYGFYAIEVLEKDDIEKKRIIDVIEEDLQLNISSDYNFVPFPDYALL